MCGHLHRAFNFMCVVHSFSLEQTDLSSFPEFPRSRRSIFLALRLCAASEYWHVVLVFSSQDLGVDNQLHIAALMCCEKEIIRR